MAHFESEHRETFHVTVPIEKAIAHFSDLERIIQLRQAEAERIVQTEPGVLHFLMKARSAKGATFQGEYFCRYRVDGTRFEWRSEGQSNMSVTGTAQFSVEGGRTRVEWVEKVEAELPVGVVLGKLLSPIVAFEMRRGMKEYVENMRRCL